jgi:hypothetical protein
VSTQASEIRNVAWDEVVPGLMLFRAVRLATSAPILLVALLALLVLPFGWHAAQFLLLGDDVINQNWFAVPPGAVAPTLSMDLEAGPPALRFPSTWQVWTAPMLALPNAGLQPVGKLFDLHASWSDRGFWAVGLLWNVAVWAFFGAIIVRTAVMQFGRGERVGLVEAAQFARRRYFAFLGAPLFPLLGLLFIALCSAPVGLLLRAEWGAWLAALLWIFVLIGALLAAVVFIGLLVGWPLMWGALASEEMGDVFEATQRSYSYTFGRPLQYGLYVLLAIVIGAVASVFVQWLAELLVYFAFWNVSGAAGQEALDAIAKPTGPSFTTNLILGLSQFVLLLPAAFRHAYFWTAAGVIYLLVRRHSDQIDFDTVFVEDQPVRFALPPLTMDGAGVPGVEEET